jgi:formylglycine-generating enzyme required for sulfatase activity
MERGISKISIVVMTMVSNACSYHETLTHSDSMVEYDVSYLDGEVEHVDGLDGHGEMDVGSDESVDAEMDASSNTPGFARIPAGTFTMGAPPTEPGIQPYEDQHIVTLTRPFEIMVTEVTQGEFSALMGYNPSRFDSCGVDCPVESTSWYEAAAYANQLSIRMGRPTCFSCTGSGMDSICSLGTEYETPYACPGYRLPTEAEWEWAARAGTTEATYNGTSTLLYCESPNEVIDPIAWYCGHPGFTTYEVGLKEPNEWGLYDMLGNVWEWSVDWITLNYDDVTIDPWGEDSGTTKITRGGAWTSIALEIRAACRAVDYPDTKSYNMGFRLVRTL